MQVVSMKQKNRDLAPDIIAYVLSGGYIPSSCSGQYVCDSKICCYLCDTKKTCVYLQIVMGWAYNN